MIQWYEVVAIICFVILFQILIYEIGYMQGEQSAYVRFKKKCVMSAETWINELVEKN